MNTVSLLAFRSHLPLSDDFQILTCSLDPRSAFPNVSLKYTEKEHTNLKCIFCQTEFTIFCPSPFPFPSFLAQKICHLCQKPGRHYAFLPSLTFATSLLTKALWHISCVPRLTPQGRPLLAQVHLICSDTSNSSLTGFLCSSLTLLQSRLHTHARVVIPK